MQNKSELESLDEEINEDDNMVNGHGENNHSLKYNLPLAMMNLNVLSLMKITFLII